MIPLKKAKGKSLFNFPGTSQHPTKKDKRKETTQPSHFLCVETRKTIKRQVSQFQRHLQTFYAPLFVCGCSDVPVFLRALVCRT